MKKYVIGLSTLILFSNTFVHSAQIAPTIYFQKDHNWVDPCTSCPTVPIIGFNPFNAPKNPHVVLALGKEKSDTPLATVYTWVKVLEDNPEATLEHVSSEQEKNLATYLKAHSGRHRRLLLELQQFVDESTIVTTFFDHGVKSTEAPQEPFNFECLPQEASPDNRLMLIAQFANLRKRYGVWPVFRINNAPEIDESTKRTIELTYHLPVSKPGEKRVVFGDRQVEKGLLGEIAFRKKYPEFPF